MNSGLLFNFNVDKSTNTVLVDKVFDAGLSLVWDAFTKPEILDLWWAPKPFISKTKYMDFRVGGRRFYAMVNQEGAEIGWQLFNFTSITPQSNFKCLSFFTDQEETPLLPSVNWDLALVSNSLQKPIIQQEKSRLETKQPKSVSLSVLSHLKNWKK